MLCRSTGRVPAVAVEPPPPPREWGVGAWVRGQRKVFVCSIGLRYSAPLIIFIFSPDQKCSDVGRLGGGGGLAAVVQNPPPPARGSVSHDPPAPRTRPRCARASLPRTDLWAKGAGGRSLGPGRPAFPVFLRRLCACVRACARVCVCVHSRSPSLPIPPGGGTEGGTGGPRHEGACE